MENQDTSSDVVNTFQSNIPNISINNSVSKEKMDKIEENNYKNTLDILIEPNTPNSSLDLGIAFDNFQYQNRNVISSSNDDVLFQSIVESANNLSKDNILSKDQYNTLIHFVSSIQNEVSELQDQTIDMREKIASMKRKYDESSLNFQQSEKHYLDSKIRTKDLIREMQKAEKQLALAQEQESELVMGIIEKERQISSLEKIIITRKREKEAKELPILEAYSRDIQTLEIELQEKIDRIQKHISQRNEIQEMISNVKNNILELHKKVKYNQERYSVLKDAPERSRKQLEIVNLAISSTKGEFDSKNIEINQLQQTINDQNKKKEVLIDTTFLMKKQEDHELKKLISIEKETKEYKSKYLQEADMYKVVGGMVFSLEQELIQKKKYLQSNQDILRSKKKEEALILEQLERFTKHNSSQKIGLENLDGKILQQEAVYSSLNKKSDRIDLELTQLKSEVDYYIHKFLEDEKLSNILQEAIQNKEKERLEFEEKVSKLESIEREVERNILSLSDERESIAREATRSKQAFLDCIADTRSIGFVNEELKKTVSELDATNKQLKKMFSMIKKDKNKIANIIQDNLQTLAQIAENKSILESEHEVLSKNSIEKEKALMKLRRLHDNHFLNREKLRSTYSNNEMELHKLQQIIIENENEISKRNILISISQDKMISLKRNFENRLEQRNLTNLQLMDRNDELSILYEKANVQDSLIKKEEVELNKRVQESSQLVKDLGILERSIEILQRRIPEKKAFEIEKDQLLAEIDKMKKLQTEIALDTSNETDEKWRILPGKNPTEEEIDEIIQQLELKIEKQNSLLMEKKLILQEITKSVSKLKNIVSREKANTLDMALGLNDTISKIRTVDQKMMSILSELSIYQATTMTQGAQIIQLNTNLERGKARMEKNEPPSEEMELEWIRQYQLELRRKRQFKDMKTRKKEIEETPASITRTTAIQRPTSYIPTDEIPIPKPYNFKPYMYSEGGSNMRHFRKPAKRNIIV